MQTLKRILGIIPGSPLRTFIIGYLIFVGLALVVAFGAYLSPADPIWALVVLLLVTGSYTQYGARRPCETRVPIPRGREDEAREVAQRLLGQHAVR